MRQSILPTMHQRIGRRILHRVFSGVLALRRGVTVGFALGVGALIGAWFIVVTSIPPRSADVVTHYSIPYGIDGIGRGWLLWSLPIVASVLTLALWIWLAPWAQRRSRHLPSFLSAGMCMVNLGVLWTLFLLRYQQVVV